MFLDEAEVEFVSGRGGSGAVSFHREKHVPRGGPNGADGGRGGSVILIAERGKRTLFDFRLKSKFEAGNGDHGEGNKRGHDGKTIEIKVPVGTVVTNTETGEQVVDMITHGMKFVLCEGGKGGKGNYHYTSSVRQAPNFAQKGAPSEIIKAKLELKLIADVGLIGLPNAGKSTLISRISAAKPKIADYPFTTIVPNLGVVRFRDDTFVVADMPGLIEGASMGIGLGHQFLRHVERNRILVHIVDTFPIDESDPVANFHLIENELRLYSEEIYNRPRIIALNKIDIAPEGRPEEIAAALAETGFPIHRISGVSGIGLDSLLARMHEMLLANQPEEEDFVVPLLPKARDMAWSVEPVADGFVVTGRRIERMVAMTDLGNDEGVRYLHRRLVRVGLIEKLREMGAEEGDTVRVGTAEFAFTDEA
jgi:GTP-binding protein